MKQFAGFPDGRLKATVLPSLFFSEAMGLIDNVSDLKLILYIFWRIGEKRSYPRFISRAELEADPVILRGVGGDARAAVRASLEHLVERKLLLDRTIEFSGQSDDYFFLNTAIGRRSIDELESRQVDLGQIVQPPEPDDRDKRASIFALYEENIGMISPILVDSLTEAENTYPPEWVEDAIRQAVLYNRRSWRYIERILERWASEGKSDETPRNGASRGYAAASRGDGRR